MTFFSVSFNRGHNLAIPGYAPNLEDVYGPTATAPNCFQEVCMAYGGHMPMMRFPATSDCSPTPERQCVEDHSI